jgi:hypothetical protein
MARQPPGHHHLKRLIARFHDKYQAAFGRKAERDASREKSISGADGCILGSQQTHFLKAIP